jgi:hypothetical protein
MYKVIHLVKRKSHLTHEQFRDHFERSHAAMAVKFCGHLFSEYRRNYVNIVLGGGDPRVEGSGFGPMEFDWDLLSEWIMPDEQSFNEVQRLMVESPEMQRLFLEDEDRFIDRQNIMMLPCTAVRETRSRPAFDARGTAFDTPTGEPSWDWCDYRLAAPDQAK